MEAEKKFIGSGYVGGHLPDSEIVSLIVEASRIWDLPGKRVLIIIPDGTRTAPITIFFKYFHQLLGDKVASLDYLIALGTHPPMSNQAVHRLIGAPLKDLSTHYPEVNVYQHLWDQDDALTTIGEISGREVSVLTQDRLTSSVPITINKIIFEYDQIIICGPVFPHEAAGFSGGNKYLFPGVSGPEVIDLIHWLGALETNLKVIGRKSTATRQIIDHAVSFISVPTLAFCMVTRNTEVAGLYVGDPILAWSNAADLSNRLHVRYYNKPFQQVLSVIPEIYEDLWTGAKGVLKVEPVVAEGGEVIIYAPHINEITRFGGEIIDNIGYHVRDYFVKQWDLYKHFPGRFLSHSTLIRGMGTYEDGTESSRIRVTLATQIPKSRCEQLNIGYLDPASIDTQAWANREDEGILLVPNAGEILYRLKDHPAY